MGILKLIGGALVLSLLAVVPAHAGRSCQEVIPDATVVQKALELAHRTRVALDASGTEIALVGRVGRDLSRQGLRYSHMAFALRDHPKGRWLLVHMLNQCGTATSGLFDEGLGNFFLDDMFAYEALITIPSRDLQQRLLEAAASRLPQSLYERSYSLISHPYSTRHQNSNQWALELIAAAAAPDGTVTTRAAAQQWLRSSGYRPSEVRLSPMERIGARLMSVNVRFDDHDASEMQSGRYQVVSVESAVRFVERIDPGARSAVIRLQ